MSTTSFQNQTDLLGSLISDTEQHLRLHRDSVSSSRKQQQSAGVHVAHPEAKHHSHHYPVHHSAASTTSSGSSDNCTGATAAGGGGHEQTAASKALLSESETSQSQVQPRSDQCCPGFAIPKGSGKTKHQNNGCLIA